MTSSHFIKTIKLTLKKHPPNEIRLIRPSLAASNPLLSLFVSGYLLFLSPSLSFFLSQIAVF